MDLNNLVQVKNQGNFSTQTCSAFSKSFISRVYLINIHYSILQLDVFWIFNAAV